MCVVIRICITFKDILLIGNTAGIFVQISNFRVSSADSWQLVSYSVDFDSWQAIVNKFKPKESFIILEPVNILNIFTK